MRLSRSRGRSLARLPKLGTRLGLALTSFDWPLLRCKEIVSNARTGVNNFLHFLENFFRPSAPRLCDRLVSPDLAQDIALVGDVLRPTTYGVSMMDISAMDIQHLVLVVPPPPTHVVCKNYFLSPAA